MRKFPSTCALGQIDAMAEVPEIDVPPTEIPSTVEPPTPWTDCRARHSGIPADLVQVTTGAGRYYIRDGTRYPSITTVLDRMGDKSALDAWRARVGEGEAERIRARSAYIGACVHDMLARYVTTGAHQVHRGPNSIEINRHYNGISRLLDSRMEELHASEARVYSTPLAVAGTVDLVCMWLVRGEPHLAVVDFKTKHKPAHPLAIDRHFLQAAFYALCWKELAGHYPNRLVIIESVEGHDEPAVHEDTLWPHRVEPLRDGGEFFTALAKSRGECQKW